jgi:hypothetical protein
MICTGLLYQHRHTSIKQHLPRTCSSLSHRINSNTEPRLTIPLISDLQHISLSSLSSLSITDRWINKIKHILNSHRHRHSHSHNTMDHRTIILRLIRSCQTNSAPNRRTGITISDTHNMASDSYHMSNITLFGRSNHFSISIISFLLFFCSSIRSLKHLELNIILRA